MARLLVVDDNLLNRKLACDVLALAGHELQQAEDADQALAVLARGPLPALILMDIQLPGMDGLALTRQLKADPRYARIPVVAMTAFAMKGDEDKALAAGCDGYITKPIDTRRLPQQVAQALAAGAPVAGPLRVMVVEDHRIDLKLAGERLRLGGHVVLGNTTAEAALDSLGSARPDVVLLDLNLPGMDGPAFVQRVRADPRTCALPIVAITAYSDKYQGQALLAAGCAAYLTKPVDTAELMQALERAARPPA